MPPLLGMPLSDMMRYAGCQKFEFGTQRATKNRKGEDITLGEWGLVVSCDWRVSDLEGGILSSDDFGPERERRDQKAQPFYDRLRDDPPLVEAIHAEDTGAVTFRLTKSQTLEIIPTNQSDKARWGMYEDFRRILLADDELWRFMPKVEEDGVEPGHFVATTKGFEIPVDPQVTRFFNAIVDGDCQVVQALLEQGVMPQYDPDAPQVTTLKFAAMESTTDMVRLLLKHNVGEGENLPVIAATRGGQIETVRLFLQLGGDADQADEIGWTPLMEASSWGYIDIVRLLVESDADVMRRTEKGYTALFVAQQGNQPEVAAYLKAQGATDLNETAL